MSLANGRPYVAIPGPSVIPDRVLQAMVRPAPNIYEGEIVTLTESLIPDLKRVAGTVDGKCAIYIGNGHAAWEAALANTLAEGDRVLVLATGRFGPGWGEMAEARGLEVETLDLGMTGPVDYDRVEDALRGREFAAVLAVFVDTSTGLMLDMARLRAALDAAGSGALLMADCIASMGCDRFEMDALGVDVAITGSQKGLMTPPGAAFVFFGTRAEAARGRLARVSRYWDWVPRTEPEGFYQYFCGTAPTHHLYGLRAALDIIAEEGLPNVWTRHDRLARAIWAACDAWGAEGPLRINVREESERSRAVTSIGLDPGQGEALRYWCADEAGVTLGIGLGREPMDAWFRIGHMGHVNAHMVLGVLAVIEAGLQATGVPHGGGALAAAAAELA